MPLLELSWGVQIMGIALMTRRGSHSTKTSKMILNLIGMNWLPSSVGTPQGNKGESGRGFGCWKPGHSTSYMPIDNMSFHILSF